VSEVKDEKLIGVYPNPSSDFIAIQLSGLTKLDLEVGVFDANGRKVRSTLVKQGSTLTYIDTTDLYPGNYFVRINDGEYPLTKSFMVVK
ncbi:MAG: T9SS type A sorting domain-containing protein, partial [Flavobacteriales bacterium]